MKHLAFQAESIFCSYSESDSQDFDEHFLLRINDAWESLVYDMKPIEQQYGIAIKKLVEADRDGLLTLVKYIKTTISKCMPFDSDESLFDIGKSEKKEIEKYYGVPEMEMLCGDKYIESTQCLSWVEERMCHIDDGGYRPVAGISWYLLRYVCEMAYARHNSHYTIFATSWRNKRDQR